jgi:hypothetical protein
MQRGYHGKEMEVVKGRGSNGAHYSSMYGLVADGK